MTDWKENHNKEILMITSRKFFIKFRSNGRTTWFGYSQTWKLKNRNRIRLIIFFKVSILLQEAMSTNLMQSDVLSLAEIRSNEWVIAWNYNLQTCWIKNSFRDWVKRVMMEVKPLSHLSGVMCRIKWLS